MQGNMVYVVRGGIRGLHPCCILHRDECYYYTNAAMLLKTVARIVSQFFMVFNVLYVALASPYGLFSPGAHRLHNMPLIYCTECLYRTTRIIS